MTAPRNVDELVFHMPTIEGRAENARAREFAASIRMQARRRNWRPSEKQLGMMRRLVSDLFSEPDNDEPILIEEGST